MFKKTSCFILKVVWVFGLGVFILPGQGFSSIQVLATPKSDYQECKRSATKKYRKDPLKIRRAIKDCRKTYPVYKLVSRCKKLVLKGEEEKSTCRKIPLMSRRLQKNSIPFIMYERLLFMHGLDLMAPKSFDAIRSDKLQCSGLIENLEKFEKSSFIFYGTSLKKLGIDDEKYSENRKEVSDGVFSLGKLFRVEKSGKRKLAYFPSGRCDYPNQQHEFINGVTQFYLIDYKNRMLYPYTTLFFYNQERLPKTKKIIADTLKRSLKKLSVKTQRDGKTFLTTKKLKSFDSDGDPRDLCSANIPALVAIIPSLEKQGLAQQSVLTNVGAYCDYITEIKSQFKDL